MRGSSYEGNGGIGGRKEGIKSCNGECLVSEETHEAVAIRRVLCGAGWAETWDEYEVGYLAEKARRSVRTSERLRDGRLHAKKGRDGGEIVTNTEKGEGILARQNVDCACGGYNSAGGDSTRSVWDRGRN